MFDPQFLASVKALALHIAAARRGEDHMQPLDVLAKKLMNEIIELDEADEQWDELPDLCYYLACLTIQTQVEFEKRGVTLEQVMAATLAKYQLRSTQPKDIQSERQAIFAAIETAR